MRSILITNDDGIGADGLARLARAAESFGEVWVVAPESQRSAASHSITLRSHIDIYPSDYPAAEVHAYACSGTPADCVRVGVLSIMPRKPDVVLCGINDGYNAASDVQYSATVGAALEAAFQGIPSIALSEQSVSRHEATDAYLGEILEKLIDARPLPGHIFNVNFPGCRPEECRGILWGRKVSRGMFYRDHYRVKKELPEGGVRLAVEGEYNEECEEGTDFRALTDRYVSVGTVNNLGYGISSGAADHFGYGFSSGAPCNPGYGISGPIEAGCGSMGKRCLKLEIFIPEAFLPRLQTALQRVDAGHIGNYDSCLSFSPVTGVWRPLEGTKPFIGETGQIASEQEMKVEVTIFEEQLDEVLHAVRDVHPYEEPVINVIPMIR